MLHVSGLVSLRAPLINTLGSEECGHGKMENMGARVRVCEHALCVFSCVSAGMCLPVRTIMNFDYTHIMDS